MYFANPDCIKKLMGDWSDMKVTRGLKWLTITVVQTVL